MAKTNFRFRKNNKRPRKGVSTLVKKEVKQQLSKNLETKYQIRYIGETVSNSGNIHCITSQVAQGTTDTTRIGDMITLNSLTMRAYFAAGDAINLLRLIIFQWYPLSDTATSPPVATDLLDDFSLSIPYIIAPFKTDYLGTRFTVLYDQTFPSVVGASNEYVVKDINVPLKYAHKKIQYSAATTEATNHLWYMCVSDSAAVTHPSSNIMYRVTYKDA